MAGGTVRRFNLDGARISLGDTIEVVFSGSLPRVRVVVEDAHFCSSDLGVSDIDDLYAGDFVVMTAGDQSGMLVSRHWMSTDLQVLSWLSGSGGSKFVDVDAVAVVLSPNEPPPLATDQASGGVAPGARTQLRPTSGVKNGERFLVASFCFSSDDFEARRGRSASVRGVYFSYLTWQYEDRRGSGASRTISATPPGVDSDHILRAITPELVRGATERWLCLTHDGSLLRVYADVRMFVGAYLQVTKTSMMLGYSAKTPCPLCDYRCPSVPGSKFEHPGNSSDVDMARTTPRTTSICRAVSAALSALDES